MSVDPSEPADPTDPVESLRRANRVLAERVAELERQLARAGAGAAGPLEASSSERAVLLAEAERIAHMGSWAWDVVTNDVRWSDELFRILGYDPATDVASTEAFFARVHPDDVARVRETSSRGIASGVAEQSDYRVLRPDGSVRHVTMDGALLFDDAGRLRRAVGTVLDVTEAREAARVLRRTAELLADAQRIANVGSYEADVETGRHHWSEHLYRIVDIDPGHPPSSAAFLDRVHPEDRGLISASIARSRRARSSPRAPASSTAMDRSATSTPRQRRCATRAAGWCRSAARSPTSPSWSGSRRSSTRARSSRRSGSSPAGSPTTSTTSSPSSSATSSGRCATGRATSCATP